MARKNQEKHDNEKMKEHLMMTNHKLTNTNVQLAAALQQITNLTAVLLQSFNSNDNHVAIKSIQLDTIATIFKCGNQACPVTM